MSRGTKMYNALIVKLLLNHYVCDYDQLVEKNNSSITTINLN